MIMKQAAAGIIAVLAAALASCSESTCYNNRNSLPKAEFYSTASGEAVSVSGLAVGGVGAPADSLLLKPSASSPIVYLPLRPNRGITEFYFTVADSVRIMSDTLTLTYTTAPFFASAECGAMYRFTITGSQLRGAGVIHSVEITDSVVTNVDATRIKIYLNASPAS